MSKQWGESTSSKGSGLLWGGCRWVAASVLRAAALTAPPSQGLALLEMTDAEESVAPGSAVAEGEDAGPGSSQANPNATTEIVRETGGVRATFTIKPENFKHRVVVPLSAVGAEVKALLSSELRISVGAISVFFQGKPVPDDVTLVSLGLEADTDVDFDLVLDYTSHISKEKAAIVAGRLPETLDVEVGQGPGKPMKLVHVSIDVSKVTRKPYLGGYRDKRNGREFHHACTNTERTRRFDEDLDRKFTRETQTYEQVTHAVQSTREACTQMARKGLLIDDFNDRVMTVGEYISADTHSGVVLEKTIIIQRNLRGYFARKKVNELRTKKQEHDRFVEDQAARAAEQAEQDRRYNIERRMRPRKRSDFRLLQDELDTWNTQETLRIKENGDMSKEEKQVALKKLLFKETKLLQTIDRLKVLAKKENKEVAVNKMLEKMSKPKRWNLKDGHAIEVHTPYTTRAIELQQLYNGLQVPVLTTEERLDVLLHVKWTVKEFDCNLTREIVDLIDREADLLSRGRNPKVLAGLRKRISHLFLTFCETPEFNPEVVRFQIDPAQFEGLIDNFDSSIRV